MAKAIYYFEAGTRDLRAIPCEADGSGNLTREGETFPFCTGARAADLPEAGAYVLESAAEEAAAKAAAEEAAAKAAAEEAAKAAAAKAAKDAKK